MGSEMCIRDRLYSGDQFQQSVMQSSKQIDKLLADIDCQSQRGQGLIKIFRTATQMEITFWQQALNAIFKVGG